MSDFFVLRNQIRVRAGSLFALTIMVMTLLSACTTNESEHPAAETTNTNKAATYSKTELNYSTKFNDNAHLLDLYIPADAKKPMPVILWVHGGAWLIGSKEETPAVFFMRSGFAVASINYRFSNQAIFPAQLYDAKAAVRWIRANASKYNLDPTRIAAFGNSAGGHLVAMLGTTGDIKELEGDLGSPTQSSKVQAVVDWCGPTNFLSMAEQGGPECRLRPEDPKGAVAQLFGGVPSKRKKLAAQASPAKFVKTGDPPFLIMHGRLDDVVPIAQSEEFCKILRDNHVPVEFLIVENGHHNFVAPEALRVVDDFLKKTLH